MTLEALIDLIEQATRQQRQRLAAALLDLPMPDLAPPVPRVHRIPITEDMCNDEPLIDFQRQPPIDSVSQRPSD